jgi:hypothetical protein
MMLEGAGMISTGIGSDSSVGGGAKQLVLSRCGESPSEATRVGCGMAVLLGFQQAASYSAVHVQANLLCCPALYNALL